jgi:hypothetical protein
MLSLTWYVGNTNKTADTNFACPFSKGEKAWLCSVGSETLLAKLGTASWDCGLAKYVKIWDAPFVLELSLLGIYLMDILNVCREVLMVSVKGIVCKRRRMEATVNCELVKLGHIQAWNLSNNGKKGIILAMEWAPYDMRTWKKVFPTYPSFCFL